MYISIPVKTRVLMSKLKIKNESEKKKQKKSKHKDPIFDIALPHRVVLHLNTS